MCTPRDDGPGKCNNSFSISYYISIVLSTYFPCNKIYNRTLFHDSD